MRLAARHNADLMAARGQVLIAEPAIRDDMGTRSDRPGDEIMQRFRGAVGDLRQTDAAGLTLGGQFDRAHDEDLARRTAPALLANRRILPRAERHLGLVDFDQRFQWVAVGVDHGPAQLVEQEPSRLVTADPELCLKLQGRHAIGMTGKRVSGEEPGLQRPMTGVQHRSRRHRGLPPTARALPGRSVPAEFPALATAAGRADKALWPASRDEIARTGGIIGKTRLKFLARHRAI